MNLKKLVAASVVTLSGVAAVAACGSTSGTGDDVHTDAQVLRSMDSGFGPVQDQTIYTENLQVAHMRCADDVNRLAQTVAETAARLGATNLAVLKSLVDATSTPGSGHSQQCVVLLGRM